MATSGWQAEKFIAYSNFSNYLSWYGNINVSSITHSGTNLRVVGTIALCCRNGESGGGGSTTLGYPHLVKPQNGSQVTICAANVKTSVGTDYHTAFDVTLTGVAATATSANISVQFSNAGNPYDVTLSWPLSFDASQTVPISGTGSFRSGNYYYSTANGWMYNTAIVSASVNESARTATISVRSLLTYYRAGGGTWTPAWGADISYDSGSSNYIKATVDGQTATSGTSIGLLGAGAALYQGNYYNLATGGVTAYGQADITKSVTFTYPASGAAMSKSWSSSINYRGTVMTVSGTVTVGAIPAAYTAPSDVTVTIDSVTDSSVTLTGKVGSYGYPDSEAKRYIRLRVYSGSDYFYAQEDATNSISATINNSSAKEGSPKLIGNTYYQADALADNTSMSAESDKVSFLTKPAEITNATYSVASNGVVTFTVVAGEEGDDETIVEEYSTDNKTWYSMSGGKVQLAKSDPVTNERIYFRRSNSAGTTSVYTLTYSVPIINPTVSVKLYSVNSTNIGLTGTVSSYGFPSNKSNRFIRLIVSDGYSYRYMDSGAVSTFTSVISNTSLLAGSSFNIIGNTRYECRAEASNGPGYAESSRINITTQPGLITRVYTTNDGRNNITATVTHEEEGNDDTVRTEYSLNGGTTWLTSATGDTFTFKITADTQVRVRRTNSSGSTTVYNTTAKYVEPVKTYLPVDGKAKKAQKIYMPVDGLAKRMRKVYMGDENGLARLTFIDDFEPEKNLWDEYVYNPNWHPKQTETDVVVDNLYLLSASEDPYEITILDDVTRFVQFIARTPGMTKFVYDNTSRGNASSSVSINFRLTREANKTVKMLAYTQSGVFAEYSYSYGVISNIDRFCTEVGWPMYIDDTFAPAPAGGDASLTKFGWRLADDGMRNDDEIDIDDDLDP